MISKLNQSFWLLLFLSVTILSNAQVKPTPAAERLKLLQRNWTAHLRRFWPTQSLAPETFAATFNAAALDENHLVRCIVSVAVNPAARR